MKRVFLWLILYSLYILPLNSQSYCSPVLIRWSMEDSTIDIFTLEERSTVLDAKSEGIVLWSDGVEEKWTYIAPTGKWIMPEEKSMEQEASWAIVSRGAENKNNPIVSSSLVSQLDQISFTSLFRGLNTIISPTNGAILLQPQIAIYRKPQDKEPKFPSETLFLVGNEKNIAITFPENRSRVALEEFSNLPEEWKKGLPPGKYEISSEVTRDTIIFWIAKEKERKEEMRLPDRLADVLESKRNPLYLQIASEYLLTRKDKKGTLKPYLSDALEVLHSMPEEELTVYLKNLKKKILHKLENPKEEIQFQNTVDATGIPVLDKIRSLFAANQWEEALKRLENWEKQENDPRGKALAKIYKAVIYAESGKKSEDIAGLFQRALEELPVDATKDIFRSYNNYANFLTKRFQDRLYNQAFQVAAGGQSLLLFSLLDWIQARSLYQKSMSLCDAKSTVDKVVCQINLMKLYALLGDLIYTLEGKENFRRGVQIAQNIAKSIYREIEKTEIEKSDPFLFANSCQIMANMSFREQNAQECISFAEKAKQNYLQAGSLTGIESISRLMGLYYLKAKEFQLADGSEISEKKALHHFSLSYLVGETLRERVPQDAIGQTLAGFFADRSYVYDKMIALLIPRGEYQEALHYVEASKAQVLQNILRLKGTSSIESPYKPRDIGQILKSWPKDIVVVEYFIGNQHSYIFLINTLGQVKAYPILESNGKNPILSRDIISKVQTFLDGMDHGAKKILKRIRMRKGVDNSWQDQLHEFANMLLPQEALLEMRKAKSVVFIPHHVLHYFPFAALVIQKDSRKLGFYDMAKPQFLLDESFSICNAPSLLTWDLLQQRKFRTIEEVNAIAISDTPGAPLEGVKKDVQNLKNAFSDRVKTIFMDQQGLEGNAKSLLKKKGILLFATHGINIAENPLESHLMLYNNDQEDGLLKSEEIFSNTVYTDMIVMSACYSGLAEKSPMAGDDLFGLVRAFLQAGCRTVVSGLWDVYDGTGPELIKVFFENIAQGFSVPESLANSQRAFLKNLRSSKGFEPWLHPYFWAVYTISGDHRLCMEKEK